MLDYLTRHAYWGRWRTPEQIRSQIASAWRVASAVDRRTGGQVAFARVLSDGVAVAYLADVFVLPEHAGNGIGTAVVEAVLAHDPERQMRWMLHTKDAHGLYRRFGFTEADAMYVERPRAEG